MSVKIISGNIFTSNCHTIVNTINCVGVMGAGIALEYRLRYPDMYKKYVFLCDKKKINIGVLWVYKSRKKWILNFPTKKHWRYPSKIEYLRAGLEKFVDIYKEEGIKSAAFPLLGSDKGGISPQESLSIMKEYLDELDIYIEIYKYDPAAPDDLYEKTKEWLLSTDIDYISEMSGLRKDYIEKLINAMRSPKIVQLNQLARIRGIGVRTLEKVFALAQNSFNCDKKGCLYEQKNLF